MHMRSVLLLLIPLLMLVAPSASMVTASNGNSNSSDEYDPPFNSLELSLDCINFYMDKIEDINVVPNPDAYCKKTIGDNCAPAGFTLEECYAFYFAPSDKDIPLEVRKSIGMKIEALKAKQ